MFGFRRPTSTKDFAVLAGLALVCLSLCLSLIPNLEHGRTEARIAWAFIQAKTLHNEIASSTNGVASDGTANARASTVTELSDLDPWGRHFQLVTRIGKEGRIVRVFSFGPDESSTSDGLDRDDIASDMKVRPTQRFEDRRRSQWQFAYGMSGTAWIVASWFYLATTHRKNQLERPPQ